MSETQSFQEDLSVHSSSIMGRNDSRSPTRGRGSPRKRSPSRREISPPRKRSSHARSAVAEKPSSRNRSPRRARSKSPVSLSPTQRRPSDHHRSPKRKTLISPASHTLSREKSSSHKKSPKQTKSRSPDSSLVQGDKSSGRARSPRHARMHSPKSRSPSPRTKRLRREEREIEEHSRERESKKNHGRASDKAAHNEKGSDRIEQSERRERKLGKDAVDNGSSKLRNGRSASPSQRHHRTRDRSRSPAGEHRNGDDDSLSRMREAEEALEAKNKVDKPSFELSGKLAAETNRVRGITLLFNEPPDARKPDIRWRLYVFKGGDVLNEPLYVHRQSCYLFGRERRVADIPTDHPSCSKQHAVLQYRQVEKENPDGTLSKQVRPYVMDLGSTNGTFINDNRIDPERYYELFEKDTLKFGNSSREYVLLHENSEG